MIIQCEQCQTKFKLDDSKVTDKGVKVRCAKCKHVFTVRKEEPEFEPAGSFGLDDSPAAAFSSAPADESPANDDHAFDFSEPTASAATDNDTFAFESNAVEPAASPASAGGDFDLSSLEEDQAFATNTDNAASEDMDFGGFDFDDGDKTMLAPPAAVAEDTADRTMIQAPQPAAAKDEMQGLDFSDDSMFGAVVAPPSEEQDSAISFDFPVGDFADSMGGAASATTGAVLHDSQNDAPFSLGEIDFGDELTSVAVQQVNPDELKPAQELLFAPLAEAQEKSEIDFGDDTLKQAFLGSETVPEAAEELPPLSISSRRKRSPMLTGLVAVFSVVAVGAVGYMGFNTFSSGSKETATAQQTGKITVGTIKAAFIKSKQAGELLVISGDAVNKFSEPRAALQVKGLVYDAKGQIIANKTAYCGNPLTNEQLADMPLDKIEAAMANQFGDSLANLEVAPGKSVPFVIVIANPPKEAKDYGVEAAGSTVATGKQP